MNDTGRASEVSGTHVLPRIKSSLLDPFFCIPLAILLALWSRRKRRSRLPLPPGPKPVPVIGNLFDMPTVKPWEVYDQWIKEYGDIIHINVLGHPIILLGSVTRTSDLFEKRSSIYSDRVRMPMLNDLMGWDFNFGFMEYGPLWRKHRKLFHDHFHPNIVPTYRPVQLQEARVFLSRLLDSPTRFPHHIRHLFASVLMKLAYGIPISDSNDPYITIAEECLSSLTIASVPGTFLVDLLPILKYVPAWMPGAGFQKKAAYWKKLNRRMAHDPFHAVKKALNQGTAAPSISASILESLPDDEPRRAQDEEDAKNCIGVAFLGGADTTVSTITSFFLAMAMYPEVQQRAQAEIDAVVGCERLPEFSDREHMPYMQALIQEVIRWQNVAPLGLPHRTTREDEYNGYRIPKGTIVIGCSWSILHDPIMYPQPHEFIPERFLKDGRINRDVRDPRVAAFGYGRRICPGRFLSENSMFSVIASVLAVFNISAPLDETGNPIQLKPDMSTGPLSYPAPFECVIKPRSDADEQRIRDAVVEFL
ncbi:putative CyP450 monooxygenase [Infundibulicybe gibba]|nr:putative CyP450 monooxygenase [Infundibulicybe gibba]